MTHGTTAGLMIWLLICTVIAVRCWKIVLFVFVCAAVSLMLLGTVEAVSFFMH